MSEQARGRTSRRPTMAPVTPIWLSLMLFFGFCMRAMQGTDSNPTHAPTNAAAQVLLAVTLTFSGLSWAAVTVDDPSGAVNSAVRRSVASALGITMQAVSVPRWTLAPSPVHGRRLSTMQASMGVTANTADLAGGISAAQVQASLIYAGDDIAKAVALASGLSSVGLAGATASPSVAPAPSRWPRPTPSPISKPAYSDGSVSDFGLVVGIILGCGLLGGAFVMCFVYARVAHLAHLFAAAQSAEGPDENAHVELTGEACLGLGLAYELTGEAWAEAGCGCGGTDECGAVVQATAELVPNPNPNPNPTAELVPAVAARTRDSALPVAMALSVPSHDSVAVAHQDAVDWPSGASGEGTDKPRQRVL